MRSLADFYRMKRHELYQTMQKGMQRSEEACIDIIDMWPYIRRLSDDLVILAATSKRSEEVFNYKLRELLRHVLVFYDHVVPLVDECRSQYAHQLFSPKRTENIKIIRESDEPFRYNL